MQNIQASKKSQTYQVIIYSVNAKPNSKALDILLSKWHSSYFYWTHIFLTAMTKAQ
jgi:hypothetical protein